MVYYAETNLIAIIIGLILLFQGRRVSSKEETSQLVMNRMLVVLIIYCISDIAAYYSRGRSYIGVETSNIAYFLSMAIGCYLWFLFVLLKMEVIKSLRKATIATCLPVLILCIAILANPITNFFFSIDSSFLYHRGPGVLLTWIVEWGYILTSIVINARTILKEKRTYKKSEYKGYLFFSIPMAVSAVTQMMFYGTTTTQIGYMIGLLMVFINQQHFQVQRDDLTGLNNMNAFLNYRDSMVNRTKGLNLTMFMIDADNFKSINDTYGHMKGDQALKDIATVLKNSVNSITNERTILFRYAGDEFIIIGGEMNQDDIQALLQAVNEQIDLKNNDNQILGEKYKLGLSVGYAQLLCSNLEEFDNLISKADEAMYKVKKEKKSRYL